MMNGLQAANNMWCEVVMVPTMYGQTVATSTAAAVAANSAAAVAAANNAAFNYPSVPAVTGIPLNKNLQVSLPNVLTAAAVAAAASAAAAAQKIDTTKHFHIFVGDLAPEIESHNLREAFCTFGVVTECKIIKDMHTQKPKGYGFVAFAVKEEAEEALQKMNGQLLGSRTIRTNWAVRKPPAPPGKGEDQKPLNYDEVSAAASLSNCTVYVGGITKGLCEELLREAFQNYGEILEVRVFKEKGYAFVRFDSHDAATRAIITMHGRDVGGQPCKCSWGKESNETDAISQLLTHPYAAYYNPVAAAAAASQLAYPYNQLGQLGSHLGSQLSSQLGSQLGSYLHQPLANNYAINYAAAAAAAGYPV